MMPTKQTAPHKKTGAPRKGVGLAKPAAAPARKRKARVIKKAGAAPASAPPKKRTDYFRVYQANRRADAAKAQMCIECTMQPRGAEKNLETGQMEAVSTRCFGCLDRARDSMRAKRANL